MPVRFYKKPVIVAGSIAFLAVLIIALFFLLYKNHTPQKEQYKAEKKQLIKIFATLDSTYWENKNKNLLLSNEAIRISKKVDDSNALAQALFNKARVMQKFEQNDSVFIISKQALIIAEMIKNDTLIARIKNIVGYYYLERENYYVAMLYYTEAIKLAEKLRNEILIGTCSNGLGLVYGALNDYDKAMDYFKRANNAFKEPSRGNIRGMAGALMNIGNCYSEKKDLHRAIFYQEKALTMAEKIHDTDMICSIYNNLGNINKYLKNNAASLRYLNQALKYSRQINNRRLYGIVLQNLGAFYIENNQLSLAENFLNQSLSVFSEIGFKSAEMKANLALSNIKKQQGQWQKAYQYHLRFIELSDSILNSETQKKISDYQWEMESQKKKYEREVLQKKYEIQKRNNIILAISIISVIIITLVVSRNLKKSIKQQKLENTHLQEKINITKKINELEKFKYKAEIEAKDKELTILSLQLVTKNEILTDISEMTNKLYKTNMMDAISFNNLKKIIKENLNLDKDWDQFKKMFENVHQIFFTKLKQTCPELTENEMRLCAYLKVNLQNREIAKILNVSQATIATNRYHIRKKLNLDKKTSLENYIREI